MMMSVNDRPIDRLAINSLGGFEGAKWLIAWEIVKSGPRRVWRIISSTNNSEDATPQRSE
ncbi:hypothetical protein HI914_05688 [Erysiphe necator]|nr:hypothetical protein HI914_05688 [Erysiphe necator]